MMTLATIGWVTQQPALARSPHRFENVAYNFARDFLFAYQDHFRWPPPKMGDFNESEYRD